MLYFFFCTIFFFSQRHVFFFFFLKEWYPRIYLVMTPFLKFPKSLRKVSWGNYYVSGTLPMIRAQKWKVVAHSYIRKIDWKRYHDILYWHHLSTFHSITIVIQSIERSEKASQNVSYMIKYDICELGLKSKKILCWIITGKILEWILWREKKKQHTHKKGIGNNQNTRQLPSALRNSWYLESCSYRVR